MKSYYKKRRLEEHIPELLKSFPVITLTGPRQAGKSTLLKHFISNQKTVWEYLTLDDRELVREINYDPALFAKSIDSNIVIDEAQKAPDLFHLLKKLVDEGFPHKVVLSGSANFLLLKNITESLAGRTGILELFPFSLSEAYSLKSNQLIEKITTSETTDELINKLNKIKKFVSEERLFSFMLRGSYPALYKNLSIDRDVFYKSYITTYVERDLRDLTQITDLDSFQKVYKLLAYQTANVVNMSNVSSDVGIDAKTVKNHSTVLEASYQCKFVTPYLYSERKRLIKKPKILFFDTGLINYFYENDDTEMMINRGQWGAILETFVFSEIHKEIINLPKRISVYFFRTNNGAEVDFVLEKANKLYAIEVKSSIKIDSQSIRGIKSLTDSYPKKIAFGVVFYRGDRLKHVDKNILAVPLQMLF